MKPKIVGDIYHRNNNGAAKKQHWLPALWHKIRKNKKPKIIVGVQVQVARRARENGLRQDNFSVLPRRINLSYAPAKKLPLKKTLKFLVFASAFTLLIFGSVTAPTILNRASGQSSDEERKALESQLQQLEGQISDYENQIVGYQKQGTTLKGEITRLNDKIAKLNLQIQAVNLTIRELDKKIGDTKKKISITEDTITSHRNALGRLLQSLYESENVSIVEIFLKNPKLSDFFGNVQNVVLLQNNLRIAIEEITDLRNQLKDQQEQFNLAKSDAESAKVYQESQKTEINTAKQEKNKVLEVTQGQENKYQTLLKQTKETASEIRKRIFKLLGGGELSFEEAYGYAKLAGGATGIRPAFILAVLDRESALGQNVGRCSYKTAMSSSNQKLFLEITSGLGINPDVVTVSCPNKDGVYGGAMGPAQFVPSTWVLYKDFVSKVTGNSPASPWNNADAFAATALYLKEAYNSSACVEYGKEISGQEVTLRERCAAAKYYAGSRWYYYRWTYGEAVVSRAQRFQDDIETITS